VSPGGIVELPPVVEPVEPPNPGTPPNPGMPLPGVWDPPAFGSTDTTEPEPGVLTLPLVGVEVPGAAGPDTGDGPLPAPPGNVPLPAVLLPEVGPPPEVSVDGAIRPLPIWEPDELEGRPPPARV